MLRNRFNLGVLRRNRRVNTRAARAPRRKASRYRPELLTLEGRTLPSTVTWLSPVSGDWDTAANWAGGHAPTSNDDAVIPFSGIQVTHDRLPAFTDTVRSIQSEAAIEISAGSLTVTNGASSRIDDLLTVNGGGTLTLNNVILNGLGTLVNSGIVNLNGSTINVAVNDVSILNLSNTIINNSPDRPFTLTGPSSFLNVTAPDFSGQSSFANAFTNATRVSVQGTLVIDHGTLVNTPEASISLAGSIVSDVDNQGTIMGLGQLGKPGGTVTNEGTIVSGPNSGLFSSSIAISNSTFVNTGTITLADARSGFGVAGGSFENDGSISGPGTLFLTNLTATLTPDEVNAVGGVSVLDCTITSPGTLNNLVAITGSTINADVLADRNLSVDAFFSSVFGDAGDTTIDGNLTVAPGVTVGIAGGIGQEETLTVTQDVTNLGTIALSGGGDGFEPTTATLTVNGTLFNQSGATITATGQFAIEGTGGPRLLNATLVNQGTLTIDEGTTLTGSVSNGGTINVRGDDLTVNLTDPATPFANTGTINVSSLRSLAIAGGDFANGGTVSLVGFGGLRVTGNYTQTGSGSTQLNNGILTAGGLLDLEGGILLGTGVINATVLNNAELDVGQAGSPGTLTIVGDYTQTASADLVIQIGGRSAGTQFDQLNITGQATLDGTLTVSLINGFHPDSGDSFQILTFGSGSGTFATLAGDGPAFSPRYNPTNVILVAN